MEFEVERIGKIGHQPGQQAEADKAAMSMAASTPARCVSRFCVKKIGIIGQVHINSFAPDCRKICSKSSLPPRHSVTRTPSVTRVFSSPSKRVGAAVEFKRRALGDGFEVFHARAFQNLQGLAIRVTPFDGHPAAVIFCPNSAIVPDMTSLPRSMMAALLQKPDKLGEDV